MAEKREIRRTESTGLIVGTLSELALEVVDSTIKLEDGKEKACKQIRANDGKFNEAIAIETDNGVFKFPAPSFCTNIKRDGTESNAYKAWHTVVTEYKDKVHYGDEADRVSLTVGYEPTFSYSTPKDDVVVYANNFRTRFISRVDKDADSSTDIQTECVVKAIRPEMRGEEETGRKIVDIMTANYGDSDTPLVGVVSSLIIPEDLVDDFEDMYSAGQTCRLNFELKNVKVGGNNGGEVRGFGRKAKVHDGFIVTERVVFGGDPAYNDDEDTEDKAYTNAEIKSLLKDFDICKKAKLQKGRAEKGNNTKSKGLGNRASKAKVKAESVDDDNPLMDDDDENPFM